MADIERRQLNEGLELRAKEGGGKTLTGYAAVFDSLSEDLGGFREIIKPGAFDRALKDKHDVRALVNHDNSLLLGRTASGTLRLSTDARGLKYEIDMPDTTAARDVAESIKRGDISGSSFGFRTIADAWPKIEGVVTREVLDLELLDVSPVTYPAYPATQVSLRALERAKAEAIVAPPEPPVAEAPVERLKREREHLDRLIEPTKNTRNAMATKYKVGDRVKIKSGKNHDSMSKDKTGTIKEISTEALGIKFDGMTETHKWYVDEEVDKA